MSKAIPTAQMEKAHWLVLLDQAVVDLGSKHVVATKLGYARPSISLAMAGKYKGSTNRLEKKVLETFGRMQCPYLSEEISAQVCREHALGEPPLHNPSSMRHYRACQGCPLNPSKIKGA